MIKDFIKNPKIQCFLFVFLYFFLNWDGEFFGVLGEFLGNFVWGYVLGYFYMKRKPKERSSWEIYRIRLIFTLLINFVFRIPYLIEAFKRGYEKGLQQKNF